MRHRWHPAPKPRPQPAADLKTLLGAAEVRKCDPYLPSIDKLDHVIAKVVDATPPTRTSSEQLST